MTFNNDVFISYNAIDNASPEPAGQGWVTLFRDSLEAMLTMRLGSRAQIFTDEAGPESSEYFDEISEQIRHSAVFIAVITPRYVGSEWALREAREFCERAETTGGLLLGKKSRALAVHLLPAQLEAMPPIFRRMAGYEFYSNEDGVPLQIDPRFGESYSQEFQRRVGRIAFDIAEVLRHIESQAYGAVEVADRGAADFNVFRESLEKDEQRPLNEMKVLFVGDGGSGKTSLIKRLLGRDFIQGEPTTHGINIEATVRRSEGGERTLRFWDFGGQEIMHATHQFFLSRRSVYVLVLDGRKEEDSEYWLGMIQTFGGDSPVLVVLNKIDQNPSFQVDGRLLQRKYPQIRGFFRISCAKREGIDELDSELMSVVERAEHVRTVWPGAWYRVKRRLEKMDRSFITYSEYERMCDEETVGLRASKTLIGFLHDLGVIMHFDTPQLRETSVIDPVWVTDAVYDVLNSQQAARSGGVLERAALSRILDPQKYPASRHDFVIELMRRFELCFEIDDSAVLIPDLLTVEEPEIEQPGGQRARVVTRYNFLPRSVMPRFMVRQHGDLDPTLRWRTGGVFEDELFASRAIVRVDAHEREVGIEVWGDYRWEYLAVLRKALRDINTSYEGTEITESVPCICEACAQSDPHFFKFDFLQQLRKEGDSVVRCERSIEKVSIENLLMGAEGPDRRLAKGWDVFVSYASGDEGAIGQIIKDLDARGITYWWDQANIRPGDRISHEIELGLRLSTCLLACLSRNQVDSSWCRAEYAGALHKLLRGQSGKVLVLLVIDDLPDTKVPMLLADLRIERMSDKVGYERVLDTLKRGAR